MRPDSQRLIDSSQQHFNPRTREGCDSKHELTKLTEAYNFNPRTREGCDFLPEQIALYHLIISIHAPVKGATGLRHIDATSKPKFQSTHP
mgnify:CR=1 FL=1